jgi:hypothetical protein
MHDIDGPLAVRARPAGKKTPLFSQRFLLVFVPSLS